MKRTACILLMGTLLFSNIGYRWVLSCMENTATARLEERIDAGDYQQNDLVEVKIPMSLPYNSGQSDYETYYGETEFNGEHYKYVKRKLANDTLFLLCIPNEEKTKIEAAKADFFKAMNGLPTEGGSQQKSLLKFLLSEFLQQNNVADFNTFCSHTKLFNPSLFNFSSQFEPTITGQPPEPRTTYIVHRT